MFHVVEYFAVTQVTRIHTVELHKFLLVFHRNYVYFNVVEILYVA